MTTEQRPIDAVDQSGPADRLAMALRARRAEAGNPSYADIATLVTRGRIDQGLGEFEARVARSTVYDLFRLGRRRIDGRLLEEVVRALGAPEVEILEWRERHRCTTEQVALVERLEQSESVAATESAEIPEAPRQMSTRIKILIALGAVLVNLLGVFTSYNLKLSLYLDMIGTAIAAIVLGPWWGVAVGLATNSASTTVNGWTALPFALVNMAGALVWGYGVRRFAMGATVRRFFLLNVIVAVSCSIVAVPIVLLVFGGTTGGGADDVTGTFMVLFNNMFASVVSSNLLTSLADKLISGFVALLVLESHLARAGQEGRQGAPPSLFRRAESRLTG